MATNFLTATAASSTNWGTAANWSGLAVPVNSDDTSIGTSAAQIDLGLGQKAVTLTKLSVPMTFTGTCGLAAQTPKAVTSITRSSNTATVTITSHGYTNGDVVIISGAAESDYNGKYVISNVAANTFDYTVANTPSTPATGTILCRKHDYLTIGATTFRYGDPGNNSIAAAGSGRFKVDFDTIQTAATIVTTKDQGTDSNLEPVRLLGTHASNVLTVLGGRVGIATTIPGEASTFATIYMDDGTLTGGSGLTWTTVYQTGGTITLNSGGTTFNQSAGTATLQGAGTVANITAAGTLNFYLRKATAGDTVTGTLWLMEGAVLNLEENPTALAVGTLRVSGSVTIRRNKANPGHFTWTTLTQDPGSSISFE